MMGMILPKPHTAVQYCKKALETRYVCLWKFIKVKEDAIHSWTNSFLLGWWEKKKKKRVDFYLLNATLNHNCMHGYIIFVLISLALAKIYYSPVKLSNLF